GDMVNEGLQEVLHTAARGEKVTCILLNNGVFGETGGHMTATSVIGQRTKNSLDGRDAEYHGYPILIGDLIAQLQGASYVARGSVHNAGSANSSPGAASRNESLSVDFRYPTEAEAFRKEFRAWLEANLPAELVGDGLGGGSMEIGGERLERLRAWNRALAEARFAAIA